jgi:uridylate kinase
MQYEYVVISLGGSLIVPDEIDWKFLKKFRETLITQIKKTNRRFIIITGGGNICRKYQQAASKATKLTKDDQDWLGIHTTRLNAHLIKTIFRDYAHPRINKNPRTKEDLNVHFEQGERIMVAAGWRPGWSTDYVATILAERLGAKTLINLSNIHYVCDKDPKKFKDAKKIKNITWKDFRKIVGNKWDPGLNMPFDPIASKLAQKLGLKVIITKGNDFTNLKKIFADKAFKGSVIEG